MRNRGDMYKIECPEFWQDGYGVYESTLREAKLTRTQTARGIGCASWSVTISRRNTRTGEYERIV